MADVITGLVRSVHVFTAIMWVGGAFLWSMVIAPRILKNGPPPIRRPFAEAVVPAITRYFQIVGGLAILSGFVLVGMIWGWSDYFAVFQPGGAEPSGYGAALGLGAAAAIGMAIVGFGIVAPTAKKMVATMQTINGPPTQAQQDQMAAIGKKMGMMSMLVMLLGSLAILGMAWAVNVVT